MALEYLDYFMKKFGNDYNTSNNKQESKQDIDYKKIYDLIKKFSSSSS